MCLMGKFQSCTMMRFRDMVRKIILAQVVAPKAKYYLNNKAPSAHP